MLSRVIITVGLLLTLCLGALHAETEPIKGIMILGGCCHDYVAQKTILAEGTSQRANIVWTLYQESDKREHKNSAYSSDDWYKGYDVVLHNECYGGVTDNDFLKRIVKAHKDGGLGGVNLHCSMHSYRNATDKDWHHYLGVDFYGHKNKSPIEVEFLMPKHPVLIGLEAFTTKEGELYTIENLHQGTEILAQGTRTINPATYPILWSNTYGKSKVMSLTLGHHNSTMEMPVFLDIVTRSLLWSVGKLNDDGTPAKGYEPIKRDNAIVDKSAK
jgi:type 1 glutamine amidotransferase